MPATNICRGVRWPTGRAQYDFLPEVNTLRIKAKDPVSGGTQSPD